MKTAISIPDDVFARAEQLARSKGFTRSQLFTEAMILYLNSAQSSDADRLRRIDALVEELGPGAFSQEHDAAIQLNRLQDEGW